MERRNIGILEEWNNGIMERWNGGVLILVLPLIVWKNIE